MKKITLYTTKTCPYCVRAKELLKSRGLTYEEILISWDDEKVWQELESRSGMKTVPQIFFGEKCVGGYTDLAALDQKGNLLKELED